MFVGVAVDKVPLWGPGPIGPVERLIYPTSYRCKARSPAPSSYPSYCNKTVASA